jgi:hypothetical protein
MSKQSQIDESEMVARMLEACTHKKRRKNISAQDYLETQDVFAVRTFTLAGRASMHYLLEQEVIELRKPKNQLDLLTLELRRLLDRDGQDAFEEGCTNILLHVAALLEIGSGRPQLNAALERIRTELSESDGPPPKVKPHLSLVTVRDAPQPG